MKIQMTAKITDDNGNEITRTMLVRRQKERRTEDYRKEKAFVKNAVSFCCHPSA